MPAYKLRLFDTQHWHLQTHTAPSFKTIQQPECFKWKTILNFIFSFDWHLFFMFARAFVLIDFDVCCSSNLSLMLFAWCSHVVISNFQSNFSHCSVTDKSYDDNFERGYCIHHDRFGIELFFNIRIMCTICTNGHRRKG